MVQDFIHQQYYYSAYLTPLDTHNVPLLTPRTFFILTKKCQLHEAMRSLEPHEFSGCKTIPGACLPSRSPQSSSYDNSPHQGVFKKANKHHGPKPYPRPRLGSPIRYLLLSPPSADAWRGDCKFYVPEGKVPAFMRRSGSDACFQVSEPHGRHHTRLLYSSVCGWLSKLWSLSGYPKY